MNQPVIWLAFCSGLVLMAQRTGFGVIYPAMVSGEGWTVAEVTGALSAAMLLYSPAAILTGFMVDRLGVRATMLVGTVVLGVFLGLISLATELWQIILLYSIGFGGGTALMGFVPMIKYLSSARSGLGFGIGLFNLGQGLGALVLTPGLQLIVDSSGWRVAFFVLTAVSVIPLLPLVLIGAPGRVRARPTATTSQTAPAPKIWRQPIFWLMFGANAGPGFLMLLPAHQVAHLIDVGVPNVMAATIGGLMGACLGLGAVLSGWLADRWSVTKLAPVSAVVMGAGVLALIFAGPNDPWLPAIYIIAGGVGRAGLGICQAWSQAKIFAGPSLGRISGVLDVAFAAGAVTGPYLTGLSYDLTGSYVPGLASAILAAAFTATTIAVSVRRWA